MRENDIVFYTYQANSKAAHACLYKDFKSESMDMIETDYDKIQKIFETTVKDISKWEYIRIEARNKDESDNVSHFIKWSEFDPRKMILLTNEEEIKTKEFNLKEMLKDRKAPGLVTKTLDKGSAFHKGKVDEGAMKDLLERSLPKAEERMKERQAKTGHAFTKNDTNKTILRRKSR